MFLANRTHYVRSLGKQVADRPTKIRSYELIKLGHAWPYGQAVQDTRRFNDLST